MWKDSEPSILDSAINQIEEQGCPFCGQAPTKVIVSGPDAIHIQPCNHTYDALATESFDHLDTVIDIEVDRCPTCGEATTDLDIRYPDISFNPCGHTTMISELDRTQ